MRFKLRIIILLSKIKENFVTKLFLMEKINNLRVIGGDAFCCLNSDLRGAVGPDEMFWRRLSKQRIYPRGRLLMRALVLIIILMVLTPLGSRAEDYSVGDLVSLIERDIHIPVHPSPGDGAVTFRFSGGSIGEILSIDAASGWLELLGEEIGGGPRTGWIAKRYIEGKLDIDGDPEGSSAGRLPQIPWCPQIGAAKPHPDGRLRIATWNLNNLHSLDGGSTYLGRDPSVKRFGLDYERIKCYVRLFDPDILAVQEVDGAAALKRVVDDNVYEVWVSQRPKPGLHGWQAEYRIRLQKRPYGGAAARRRLIRCKQW